MAWPRAAAIKRKTIFTAKITARPSRNQKEKTMFYHEGHEDHEVSREFY
jgi:hypothetical protein